MYNGSFSGGVFEDRIKGVSCKPLNQGCAADFLPMPDPEYGHDPHCVRLHPLMPDRLYQQNHCGIYRMERAEGHWIRIGKNMPKKTGDVGFPLALHPRDPDTVWVFPMDGTTVWPRTSPDGKPAAYVTRNAGKTWKRQDNGLPPSQAWWTVKRQAMAADTREESVVEGSGSNLGELLADMDRRYPGFRFRIIDEQDGIRQHIKIFVNQEQAGTLEASLRSTDEVHIICALSGGRGSDLGP